MLAALPERPRSPFPERVGRYELLLPIGTGGNATVYLATTTGVGGFRREVALKLVHAHLRADEESNLYLLEEARLAARVRHPNVIPVIEVGEDPFGVFLVMDYVEGDTLSGLIRSAQATGKPIPPRMAARILDDALAGLHAAHELKDDQGRPLGVVHRDFSPQNILVDVEGIARLNDFGIAKAASRNVRTATGLIKGKISYMSPEQARGHSLDRRCDVWAAGIVAWELLAGRRLYRQEDEVATLLKIVTEEPPALRSVNAEIPHAVETAVSWALKTDTAERTASAEELRASLSAAWRISGSDMATTQELGAYVRELVGPALEKRRRSAAEVLLLRQRMGELVKPIEPSSGHHVAPLERSSSRSGAASVGVSSEALFMPPTGDESDQHPTRVEGALREPADTAASHSRPKLMRGAAVALTVTAVALAIYRMSPVAWLGFAPDEKPDNAAAGELDTVGSPAAPLPAQATPSPAREPEASAGATSLAESPTAPALGAASAEIPRATAAGGQTSSSAGTAPPKVHEAPEGSAQRRSRSTTTPAPKVSSAPKRVGPSSAPPSTLAEDPYGNPR